MIHYSFFNKTPNHAFNVCNAINDCRKNNADGIVFDKGEYHFYPDMASESVMCVSNHDIYGFRRIAFLIADMDGFCIDGGGSTFVFHGDLVPVFINHAANVKIKNVIIDYEKSKILELTVTEANDSYFDAAVDFDGEYFVKDGILNIRSGYSETDTLHLLLRRSDGGQKNGCGMAEMFFSQKPSPIADIGGGKLRFWNCALQVKAGMRLLAMGGKRFLCNIVIQKSTNVTIESVKMYSGYAMGVLAQMSRDITIDKMVVKARDGRLFSLAADATHFVNCTGLVKIANSSFSDQMDDALNIHGIFTRIVDKSENAVIVRYMHRSAKGIDIYRVGDKIAVVNPRSLVGNQYYIVRDVDVINLEYTRLFIDKSTDDITVGDLVENITNNCDLIFENNRVFNNRARGILIGTKGSADIRNNYFRSGGTAICFESDGEKWFESGGTNDVRIYGNTFENCCTGPSYWGRQVIWTVPRKEWIDGMYYHKFISITDNRFIGNSVPVLYADNIAHLVFRDNRADGKMEYTAERCGKISLCAPVNTDCK